MPEFVRLPPSAAPAEYERQAEAALEGWRNGDKEAIELVANSHPHFFDEKIPWLRREMTEDEVSRFPLDMDAARLAIARWYQFGGWPELMEWAAAASDPRSDVAKFEQAVEAVVDGDAATLRRLLAENPGLVRARSTRITPHDPPVHASTLLHYLGANGVEGYRQRTPANAVEIAKILLDAGADVNSTASLYGDQCDTMTLLVSSCHPAQAGMQIPLAETLLDYGARSEGALETAIAFGYLGTARALLRRGAPVRNLPTAAALGQRDEVTRRLPTASAEDRHRATSVAAQHGQTEIVEMLLDAGEDPNRFNLKGNHAHSTPLHQAACAGHLDTVRLLIARGADPRIRDTIYHGDALGWAEHCGRPEIAAYLRSLPIASQ